MIGVLCCCLPQKRIESSIILQVNTRYALKTILKLIIFSGLGCSKSFRFLNGKWIKINHLNLVKGTLLFGEFVKEICTYHPGCETFEERYSLHVIDAIRLGDMDLRSYTYSERCPSLVRPFNFCTDFDSFQVKFHRDVLQIGEQRIAIRVFGAFTP